MIKIEKSDILLENLLLHNNIDDETRDRVKDADILLLPDADIRDGVRAFQGQTLHFYKYARAKEGFGRIELLENRGQEQVLSLHDHNVFLPTTFVSLVALPILLNLISSFLYDRYKKDREKVNVSFSIIVEDLEKRTSKKINYEGPVRGLDKTLKSIDINRIFKDTDNA